MNKDAKIYIAGHRGMVGSAIVENLTNNEYSNLVIATNHSNIDYAELAEWLCGGYKKCDEEYKAQK